MNDTAMPQRSSRRFNDLPYDHRLIAIAVILETQINQIRVDQERARSAHRKFMSEANAHLRNLERSLIDRLAEIDQASSNSQSEANGLNEVNMDTDIHCPRDVVIASFGYLHGPAPRADIVVDVREHLRDPHVDPAFRELTGHDPVVRDRVLATPGARGLIAGLARAIGGLHREGGRTVRVAIGCAGGRHRSVVIAEAIAREITDARADWDVQVRHYHVYEPVVMGRERSTDGNLD